MKQQTVLVVLLIALVCIGQFEAKSSDCSCGWANGGRTCGSNDGSKCWKECCGKKKRSSVDNEEKSGKVLVDEEDLKN
ncbi:hypothetical protein BpHYR1_027851 [Brachionus plicatilis]|uniref:Uncharacterized protein n=1 Tax=Brachionus plicatilis TaxID=10195 RepID=A0A3M7RP91_BRAPC|nr:hypothetical protein BpHYR1_027851 [Brachionus plicatilis]